METVTCVMNSSINKIDSFSKSHLPQLSQESIDNFRFIGETIKFNTETELLVKRLISNLDFDLYLVKRVQRLVLRLAELTQDQNDLTRDEHMSTFLSNCFRQYKEMNSMLVGAIKAKYSEDYTKERHAELTSRYKDIIEVYSN